MGIRDLLERSSCPYCRGRLEFESLGEAATTLGTARCACYTYPVIDGIVVLRQFSGPSDAVDPAVERLRAGDAAGARRELRRCGSMVAAHDARGEGVLQRAKAGLRGLGLRGRHSPSGHKLHPTAAAAGGDAPVREALEHDRPPGFADYLFQRYANPSFMAAVPALSITRSAAARGPSATVLDLGCGVGHSTALLSTLVTPGSVVAADPDFVNLELLRRHFAPDAVCVCLDAELPLPFDDDVFDVAVCLDAFHYIRSKWALARELERVTNVDPGLLVFPHLHNALVANLAPGVPLAPDDYIRMFPLWDARLYDEAEILRRAVDEGTVDFAASTAPGALADVPNLTMIAGRDPDVFRTYRLADVRDLATVGVNPIYSTVAHDERQIVLEAAWPNPELERECEAAHRHLPKRTTLDRHLLERLVATSLSADDERVVHDLLSRSVLVELAVGYERLPALLRRTSATAE